jgi:thiamine biosynthesis lipoprotein
MRWVKKALIALVIVAISCGEHEGFRAYQGEAQGTTFSIKYDYPNHDFEDEFDSILNSMDLHFSTYLEGSMISQINGSDKPVMVDELFIDLWEKCWDINITTNGYFDPTLEPVLAIYNFDNNQELYVDSTVVEEALKLTGMHLVRIQNNELTKKNKDVKLNFNAVAQGYSVDVVAEFLERKNATNYMVEIGGELRVKGVNDKNKPWTIGIDKPLLNQPRELLLKTSLRDMSLATSGNYRKFKTINGGNFGHIINPKTGYAEQSTVLSVSVLARSCYRADAMATAFMNMQVNNIIEMERDDPDLSVIVIYLESSDTTVYVSPGIEVTYFK